MEYQHNFDFSDVCGCWISTHIFILILFLLLKKMPSQFICLFTHRMIWLCLVTFSLCLFTYLWTLDINVLLRIYLAKVFLSLSPWCWPLSYAGTLWFQVIPLVSLCDYFQHYWSLFTGSPCLCLYLTISLCFPLAVSNFQVIS